MDELFDVNPELDSPEDYVIKSSSFDSNTVFENKVTATAENGESSRSLGRSNTISIPGTIDVSTFTEIEMPPVVQEKRHARPQPRGTIEHQVTCSDTLESIAAQFDTTPSELAKLNKMPSRMIYPGQVLYIPDKDYVSSGSISPDSTSPPDPACESRGKHDVPIVRMAEKSSRRGPGHAERLTSPVISPAADSKVRSKSIDDSKQLDQECYERFIKTHVKHITDGQGVVNGVLLVTPNAVMFDPNVSDPLVIEHGPETYGMITPLDMVISAALYHDIAAMRLRGQKDDRPLTPRPEVYHAKECPMFHQPSARHQEVIYQGTMDLDDIEKDAETCLENGPEDAPNLRVPSIVSPQSDGDSVCSCSGIKSTHQELNSITENMAELSVGGENLNETFPVSQEDSSARLAPMISGTLENKAEENSGDQSEDFTSVKTIVNSKTECISQQEVEYDSRVDNISMETTIPRVRDSQTDECNMTMDSAVGSRDRDVFTSPDVNRQQTAKDLSECVAPVKSEHAADDLVNICDDKFEHFSSEIDTGRSEDVLKSEMKIGNITYMPYDSINLPSTSTLPASEQCDPEPNLASSKSDEASGLGSHLIGSLESSSHLIGSLGSKASPHISAFVNYATGLFRNTPDDRTNVQDLSSGHMPIETNLEKPIQKGNSHPTVAVESAVTLADKPHLFLDIDKLVPRPAARYEDPPLYLCLRIGIPRNKNVSQTCPMEAYSRKRRKPEYWFSIPRDKVDPLYAFFVQWSPEIYGDQEELDAETRGFVVIQEDAETPDDQLDIFTKRFGSPRSIHKDWEGNNGSSNEERVTSIDTSKQNKSVSHNLEKVHHGAKKSHKLWEFRFQQISETIKFKLFENHFGEGTRSTKMKVDKSWEIVSQSEAIRRRSVINEDMLPLPELIGQSVILTDDAVRQLSKQLPGRAVGYPWNLVYSTDQHGFSLTTLYRKMRKETGIDGPILIVVKDTKNRIFGALTSCPLKMSDHFYGTGESFLFTFHPEFKVFRWTGDNNFFNKGNKESMSIGSGHGVFGLWMDGDIYHGRSNHCDTYDNDVLPGEEDFVVKGLEAWSFE